jgi:hypothetical protein
MNDQGRSSQRRRRTPGKQEKRNKWRDAIKHFLDLESKYPKQRGEPGNTYPPNLVSGVVPNDLRRPEFERTSKLLRTVARLDATTYSLVLQTFLASVGLSWPNGVFKQDFAVPDSGRPLSRLGQDARDWHIPNKFGWRATARVLLPNEFESDPDGATNKVRRAARSYEECRASIREAILPADAAMRLDELIGLKGLEALAIQVLERKLEAYGIVTREDLIAGWKDLLDKYRDCDELIIGVKGQEASATLREDVITGWKDLGDKYRDRQSTS